MTRDNRLEKILELLNKQGSVNVSELAEKFGLSEMSIRNDLNYLSEHGKLQRIYGGAVSWTTSSLELTLRDKEQKNLKAKNLIGKRTAELIQDGDTIMFDSGTTTQQVAKNLSDLNHITVITNGINIINTLAGLDWVTLYTVGGQISAKSYAITGPEAEESLKRYLSKLCIISVDGVDIEKGLTNNSVSDAHITKILIERSTKKILVSDSSKLGRIAMVPICPLETVDILITDYNAPQKYIAETINLGIQVIIAKEDSN